MKKLFTLAAFVLLYLNGFAQNAYYDALFCASLNIEDANYANYETYNLSKGDQEELKKMSAFLKDPFKTPKPDFERVKTVFSTIKAGEQAAIRMNGFTGIEVLGLLTPIFNLSKMSSAQTDTLLYGLTVYLADEFRKGYMQTYMNSVKKSIGKSGELQILFPSSYEKMLTYDPIRYKDFGNEMKAVFDEDLSHSLENLMKHIENPQKIAPETKYNLLTETYCGSLKSSKGFPYLKLSAEAGQKLINGIHPSDLLGYLDETYYENSDEQKQKIGKKLHLINVLQRNLRDTASQQSGQFSNIWLNFEKFSKLNNPSVSKYFLALLYAEDATFFEESFQKINTNWKLSASNQKDLFVKFKQNEITPLLSILTKLDELTKLKDKNLLEEKNFALYLDTVAELITLLIADEDKKEVAKIKALTINTFHLYNAVRVKNYANTPLYLGNILKHLPNEKVDSIINEIEGFIKKLDTFSSFSAGIVNAKTSEEVSKVIKNYASPPASFANKRLGSGMKFSLGGMPGLYLASETFDGSSNAAFNTGLSLPLGLDISWRLNKDAKTSWGLFLQALDLGAMLNYRLNSKSNTLPDKVDWASVLSPGAALSFGLPESPWTVQVGYQRSPALRKINKGGNEPLVEANRWQIRFAYDIPLLNIGTIK